MSSEQLNPGASNGQGNNGSDADEQQRIDEEREHEQQLNAEKRDQQDQRKRDDNAKDDRRAAEDVTAAANDQVDARRDFDLAREDQLRRDDNRRDSIKKQDLDRLRRGAERAELVQPKSSASAGADRPGQPAGSASAQKGESESNMFRKMPSYVAAGPGSLSAAQQASLAAGREAADREQMNREHANAQRELSRRIDLARDPRQRAQLQEQLEEAEHAHNEQRARWLESTDGGRAALGQEEVEFRRGVREETRQKLAARQEQLRKREEELGLRPAAKQQDTLQLEDKRDEQKGFEFKR